MRRRYSIPAAFAVSLFVYLFYRSEKTLVNELAIMLLSFDTYATLRASIATALPLDGAFIFSIPGGLWVFCVTAASRDFYIELLEHRISAVFIPIVFAVGLEFCQLIGLTRGTFDLWDIGFYVAFWLLALNAFPINATYTPGFFLRSMFSVGVPGACQRIAIEESHKP